MRIYLVGGAVRDQLLGLPIKERDYVVVGATVNAMLDLGYQQVGKDFPVFLHPETKEEYALARVERKVGRGYTGFSFDVSPAVTLEEDLKRRDITINAIAQSVEKGEVIDPYQGRSDLDKRILRHVSDAFVEDPVRVLRVARFAARFCALDFTVAPETMKLMCDMVAAGEVNALVAERVWKELERALGEGHPEKFFEVLAACGASKILFSCSESFAIKALIEAAKLTGDKRIRFAALLHRLTQQQIKVLCERYRIPMEYKELALLVSGYIDDYKRTQQLSVDEIVGLLYATDSFRREQRFENFLLACEACESHSYLALWREYLKAAKTVKVDELVSQGLSGKEIAEKLAQKRKEAIIAINKI